MGSSAEISSGVCRCGSQDKVPEERSGKFRRVPAGAGVGSGGKFRKLPAQVPEGFAAFRCLLVQVPEAGSGGLQPLLVQLPEARFGRFRRVPVCAVGQVPEGSGAFRRGLLPCSHVIVLNIFFVMTLSTWVKPLSKPNGGDVVKHGIKMIHMYQYIYYALLLLGMPPKFIF